MPCPCGYELKPGMVDVAVIDHVIIDAMIATYPAAKLAVMLDPLLGRYLDATTLCQQEPPDPITPTVEWYTQPWNHLDDILNNLIASNWNLYCQCQPCPPIAGCTGGNSFIISNTSGSSIDPFYDSWRYVIPGAAQFYVQRMDTLACFGPFTGLEINWCLALGPCGGTSANARNYNGTGVVTLFTADTVNPQLRIFMGDGNGGIAGPPFPTLPITIDDPPVAEICDPTTICTAIQPIADQVEVIRRILTDIAGGVQGVAGDYSFTIPGITGTIAGTLNETLTKAFVALAPLAPSQLANPVMDAIDTSSLVDVADRAYVLIQPIEIPDRMGYRGEGDSAIYYSRANSPGPGWVVVFGQDGVIAEYTIRYPTGIEFALPPTASSMAIHLEPGVEVEVTTWQRAV